MLFLLIFLFSSIFFLKSFTFNPPPSSPPMMREFKLFFSPFFWEEISSFLFSWFPKHKITIGFYQVPHKMPLKKIHLRFKETENLEQNNSSLLDLPELALDCILEKLSPSGLCSMTGVCSFLRDKCTSDHLWEKHLKQKWSSVIGDAAFKEWQFHSASRKRLALANQSNPKSLLGSLGIVCTLSRIKPKFESRSNPRTTSLSADSIMAMYLSLEKGKFCFPAQVYNREVLSLWARMIEDGIVWDRLRAPPIETPAHDLHISECLNELKPGDHIEIQWRRSKEFPYGWWYAIVGHIDTCDGNENRCHCQYNDKVALEFNQYSHGSRWRQTIINRKDHSEEGNEADGFYGGIRKLYSTEEISTWKKLWPSQVFE